MNSIHRLIGGVLLVAGTTIGAGMLALPIVTGFAGFVPSMALFFAYWIYMTFTAFLMLEANLWMNEHANLVTMANETLGKVGKIFCWAVYLFLLYALTTAYLAGGGPIFIELIEAAAGRSLPAWTGPLPLLLLFGFFVYQGARSVDLINRVLMIGLAIFYVLMCALLTPYIQLPHLAHSNWSAVWIAVPIVSTSFGFHIIIPTLTDYLHRDVRQLKWVLIIGSAIPLLVYVSWELLSLGIIPLEGSFGLAEGFRRGIDGATLLGEYLGKAELSLPARLFSLFAITTSFLGVSLSLRDFLADGLNIKKTPKGRLALYLITFIPPLAIAFIDPRAFLNALEYAGAFGVVALLGLLPVLMVWRGRYMQHRVGEFRTPGGKWALIAALIISSCVIGFEIARKMGVLTDNV